MCVVYCVAKYFAKRDQTAFYIEISPSLMRPIWLYLSLLLPKKAYFHKIKGDIQTDQLKLV